MARGAQSGLAGDELPPFVSSDRVWHVTPVADLREHVHDTRGKCWCNPSIEPEGTHWLIVHHAMDCRELYETGVREFS